MLANRYVLERLLGRGGMGEVYEAVAVGEHGFRRRVAIKRLLAESAGDDAVLAMFADEARIASRLHHGSIVGIFDFGVVDGIPFHVLELVDGITAADALERTLGRRESVPIEAALVIVIDTARALHHAHEARDENESPLGIVHRDVKPSNILLSRAGDVKLGDFGIARAKGRLQQATGDLTKGTRGFMAPEQLTGSPVDARTDVFGLGCTLHVLLTGASPLGTPSAVVNLMAGATPPVSDGLPGDVRDIVLRCVQAKPHARFATALEVAEAAGRALASRLESDAKTALLAWLTPLIDAAPTPSRPTNGVADTSAELTAAGTFGASRTFTSVGPPLPEPGLGRRARTTPPEVPPPTVPPARPMAFATPAPPPLPSAPLARGPRRSRRRRTSRTLWFVLGAALPLVLAALAVAAWLVLGPPP